MSSGTAITEAIAVSLMVIESNDPNAGSIRTIACGRMIRRRTCLLDIPSVSAARVWPGRTDSMPARTISAADAARWMVSASNAGANGGIVRPAAIGSAKNVQTVTTSTGIARLELMEGTTDRFNQVGPYSGAI